MPHLSLICTPASVGSRTLSRRVRSSGCFSTAQLSILIGLRSVICVCITVTIGFSRQFANDNLPQDLMSRHLCSFVPPSAQTFSSRRSKPLNMLFKNHSLIAKRCLIKISIISQQNTQKYYVYTRSECPSPRSFSSIHPFCLTTIDAQHPFLPCLFLLCFWRNKETTGITLIQKYTHRKEITRNRPVSSSPTCPTPVLP